VPLPVELPSALSDGLVLRLLEEGDAGRLALAYRRNRAHLAPWEPARTADFFTVGAQRDAIATRLAQHEAGAALPLVLVSHTDIVGRMTLSGIVRGPFQSASVGYWVDAELTGRGLASAVLHATVELARDDLGLHRLEASTLVHNLASQRVLDHAGFEQIGLAPRYLQIAGQWQDNKLFQKILHD
jgi:ribosomal-protein-alanine N-acetyltransferase